MAYRFLTSDADLTSGLRRIALSELTAAAAHLDKGRAPPATGVHDLRKRIKKLRGLLRLVRPGFPDFDHENAALRDTAHALSGLRDAEVRLATFDKLAGSPCPRTLQKLRRHLVAERDASQHVHTDIGPPRQALLALIQRAREWKLHGKDDEVLLQGLTDTRRAGIARMEAAAHHRGFEEIHDWRKRAKDLWYQTRLLQPLWPEALDPLGETLSKLTEDLGDHHDIAVLIEHLQTLPVGTLGTVAAVNLKANGDEAKDRIEREIFTIGERVYAGKPAAIAQQWLDWWIAWRK